MRRARPRPESPPVPAAPKPAGLAQQSRFSRKQQICGKKQARRLPEKAAGLERKRGSEEAVDLGKKTQKERRTTTTKFPKKQSFHRKIDKNQTVTAPINAVFVCLTLGMVSTVSFLGRDTAVPQDPLMFKGRSLLSAHGDEPGSKPFTRSEIIGFTIGSISSVLYLCSRVPQIYTNYKRKSTAGVSYSLFALVMLGNSLYGLSVLLKNPEPGQGEGDYVLHHLPWLVGSLGVLSLDVVISFQFLAYRGGRPGTREERDALLGEQGDNLES
ncbi:lysosomal amino acid transporter 1 homolog isoform X3 [Columba livia]|uniref:lysosomal amino acid transporter 1 homolog isoform X3 n=1 Tax=Columba livia TaxID=8932 RepID=UPI0031BAA96B